MTPPGWDWEMLEEVKGTGKPSLDGLHDGTQLQHASDLADIKSELFLLGSKDAHHIPGDPSPAALGLEHMHLYFGYLLSPGSPTVPLISLFSRTQDNLLTGWLLCLIYIRFWLNICHSSALANSGSKLLPRW